MTKFYIKPDNRAKDFAMSFIDQLPEHEKFTVSIKKGVDSKTAQQRNYFHALLKIISDYSGYTIDDLKTRLCFTLEKVKQVKLKEGGTILQRLSTEELNKIGYSELIEAACQALDSIGLEYPPPKYYGSEYGEFK